MRPSVCHCNSLGGATWRSITGRTDRRTDRVRRNMRPPPREEGRIKIQNQGHGSVTLRSSTSDSVKQVFHLWWCETCRVIRQQLWMKECDILGERSKHTLTPPKYFQGSRLPKIYASVNRRVQWVTMSNQNQPIRANEGRLPPVSSQRWPLMTRWPVTSAAAAGTHRVWPARLLLLPVRGACGVFRVELSTFELWCWFVAERRSATAAKNNNGCHCWR